MTSTTRADISGDRLIRTANRTDSRSRAWPVDRGELNILTRKTLGGFETDLDSRVSAATARSCRGFTPPASSRLRRRRMHGYRRSKAPFLGGCLMSVW